LKELSGLGVSNETLQSPMAKWTAEEIAVRRAKRQERRDKQRLANVGRAAKMRAVRLAYEAHRPAAQAAHRRKSRIHIGCSGWFYWHWRGIFYPKGLPTKRWFAHYAQHFRTVELNAPFYSWPTVNTVISWKKQAGRRKFIYAVKVCELITHVKRFARTGTFVRDFGHIADLLGEHFGCFLFQLPPSFHFTRARLRNIVSQLEPTRKNVVEFRHKSWWNEATYAAFRDNGIIFCSCSAPRLPDELIKTDDDVYVRFHGTTQWYRHDYSNEELRVWARRIKSSKAKEVWAYFNNDRDGNAICNGRSLAKLL